MPETTPAHCPALLIAAPASGQGKTTLVAALARHHRNQGRDVRVFKTGPDFLDPKIHEQASGNTVHQLDLWMVGEDNCRRLLHQAAREADLILVEGVMGLFDGSPSSADLARHFGIPVAALIDAGAMAQTFGAVAQGLATYQSDLPFAGVFANRASSEGHCTMLKASLPATLPWLGNLPRTDTIELPHRHLGLHQPEAIANLDGRLDAAATLIGQTALANLPAAVTFQPAPVADIPPLLEGQKIAVARDSAFSFVYPANLALLQAMGAQLHYFSPLSDTRLPACDSLYLPGGYPELHLDMLADNTVMHEAIRQHYKADKPIVAECGGMLFLLDALTDQQGRCRSMAGLIPTSATVQQRVSAIGSQYAAFGNEQLHGHTFHYSSFDREPDMAARGIRHPWGSQGEGIYRSRALTASYIHWYLPSNPRAAAALFRGDA